MLINEKHLSLVDPEAESTCNRKWTSTFQGEDYDKAEGYVPPSESTATGQRLDSGKARIRV